jgi:multidrug resistance efflux pump
LTPIGRLEKRTFIQSKLSRPNQWFAPRKSKLRYAAINDADAEQKVDQLKASLDQATAAAGRADPQLQLAQQNYDRQNELFQKNVIAKATLDTYTRNLDAAKQTPAAAQAEQERARLAYTANVGGVNTSVAQQRAELADAEFDLDQTTVRAAGPGFVTQVSLRPKMYVVPAQFRTAMVFVNTVRAIRNWERRSIKMPCSGSMRATMRKSFLTPCRVAYSRPKCVP